MIDSTVRILLLGGVWLSVSALQAAKNDWAEGTPGQNNGASREYYNRAGLLKWTNFLGDWRDRDNKAQGDAPYAQAEVKSATEMIFEWDVTALVEEWRTGKSQNQGFFVRSLEGRGPIEFCSREHPEKERRPQLILYGMGKTLTLSPEADTFLESSTYRCQGQRETLIVSNRPNNLLIRFDLRQADGLREISKATLRLSLARQNATATIGVFRCSQGHDEPSTPVEWGLAARYPGDKGIQDDADVIFAADFEPAAWDEAWSHVAERKALDIVASDPKRKFEPLFGNALQVRIAEGSTGALNMLYKFQKETGQEPEETYFRYYLRLGDDWNQTLEGGKLPGLSGTYGKAGWGGRKVNGNDGWSARGLFTLTIPKDNPLGGTTPIGTYCYHADMEGNYGSHWVWQKDYRGFLENNRWYCLEQYVKLNTPGEKNGILRAWVDGRLAFEKSDIRFREVEKLKIEQLWMNVYHGGTRPSPYDQHIFIDQVVIAKKYIGPMKHPD